MSVYRYMSLSAKRGHLAQGGKTHPGRAYKPRSQFQPAMTTCEKCNARVPVEESGAHRARCQK